MVNHLLPAIVLLRLRLLDSVAHAQESADSDPRCVNHSLALAVIAADLRAIAHELGALPVGS
jgi:hypothetical protein